MARARRVRTMNTVVSSNNLVIAAVVAILVSFSATITNAVAATPADSLSDGDKACLGCHGFDGMSKTLADGTTLSLHVKGEEFAKSVHGAIGCAACHADIDLKTHPQLTKAIRDKHNYAVSMTKVCAGCHGEVAKQNEFGVHANLVASGKRSAPVCTDCHGTHAINPDTAYNTCVGCHQAAMDTHQKWLPNAGLHLGVVSCAACHAPKAKRMLDLRLYDSATKSWVVDKGDPPQFEKMARAADTDGNGLDAGELRKMMALINRDPAAPQKSLRGRIELRNDAEAHQLSGKTKAIKDCSDCHQKGAEPFQNVTVSVVSADGKPVRYKAHYEVLGSVLSVDSLREFYAVGGTRNLVLDVLLILAVLGGLAVPVGHQILKRIVQSELERSANAGASAKHKKHSGA
jgi:hypothetical protein